MRNRLITLVVVMCGALVPLVAPPTPHPTEAWEVDTATDYPHTVTVTAEDGTTTINYTDGGDTASGGVVLSPAGDVIGHWGTVPEDSGYWNCETMGNRQC